MIDWVQRQTAGYSDHPVPLAGYAVLSAVFNAGVGSFLAARRHHLPARVSMADTVLIGVATHRLSRLIARDKVTRFVRAPFTRFERDADAPGEVEESPRGEGLRRAVGELVTCPTCLGLWIGAGFTAAYAVAPRSTRLVAAIFAVDGVSAALNLAWAGEAERAKAARRPAARAVRPQAEPETAPAQ